MLLTARTSTSPLHILSPLLFLTEDFHTIISLSLCSFKKCGSDTFSVWTFRIPKFQFLESIFNLNHVDDGAIHKKF